MAKNEDDGDTWSPKHNMPIARHAYKLDGWLCYWCQVCQIGFIYGLVWWRYASSVCSSLE